MAEAFNCSFHQRFDQDHSGLHTLIKKLKDTQSNTEQDIHFTMCNPDMVVSEKDHITKINKLKEICKNYKSYYETYYLQSISVTYNWYIDDL